MPIEPLPRSPWDASRPEPDFLRGSDIEKRLLTWSHLEYQRLEKLGWAHRYSRHFVLHHDRANPPLPTTPLPKALVRPEATATKVEAGVPRTNSLAPFFTVKLLRCGWLFSWDCDNRRKLFTEIEHADVVKWRPTLYGPLRKSVVPAK